MVRIFEQSETTKSMKYTGYISDGYAKTFHAITEANSYESGVKASKIKCVVHIQTTKRTRLR